MCLGSAVFGLTPSTAIRQSFALVNTLQPETDRYFGSVLLGLTTLMHSLTHCSPDLQVCWFCSARSDTMHRYKAVFWCTAQHTAVQIDTCLWLCSADYVNVLVNTLQSEADRCLGSVLLTLIFWLTHCNLRLTCVLAVFC